ncbi:MAG TPA: 6,7-dimethyl-8-ribityllumazine synthase [Pseudobdellovibrionaceae bacterium]|nr:6,7-dimethyl-8-ribityllumazine synthase [Pseudobdellovibrionaceae bacterium]
MKRSVKSKARDQARQAGAVRGDLDGRKLRIGIVTARWNADITDRLQAGAYLALARSGVKASNLMSVSVPGAYEAPLAAKALLEKDCDAVIVLACVIRGETTHYDYVCNAVERGCSQLQLDYQRPVVFGVLTVENRKQAMDRVGGAHGHKGIEAGEVAVEMAQLLSLVRRKSRKALSAK